MTTGGVLKECKPTDGRVIAAGGVISERVVTQKCIGADEVAALLTRRARLRQKRNAREDQDNEK